MSPPGLGTCPGDEESAAVNYSCRSPNGNRHMRRILNQAANAAAKAKESIFETVYPAWSRAWDTTKRLGPLLIDSVD